MSTIYGNALILPSKDGGAKETWVLNETLDTTELEVSVSFKCDNVSYNSIKRYDNKNKIATKYDTTIVASDTNSWISQAYRKLTFDAPPTGALLTWLQSNAVKQPDDTAVQDTKALTITSNGTVSVTPDAPYDALKKVDVTVNVSGGGGGGTGCKVTFPATAANWSYVISGGIVQADGTVVDMYDYTNISGKTFSNVVAIKCSGQMYHTLRMAILSGKINIIFDNGATVTSHLAVDGETTYVTMGTGNTTVWIPLADTVISAIEMYNTD